jgi:hypothetical protein
MGNLAVLEPSGLLHNPEKKCLVGSSATIMQCINYLASLDIVSVDDLITMGLHNPLRAIKMDIKDLRQNNRYRWDDINRTFIHEI